MQESVEYSLHLGSTPLFLAALAGHLGVVQILIQAAAQVDSLDATFWIDHSPFTPCFLHVNWTKVELLTLMLILSMGGAGVTGNGMMSVVQDSTNININDGMTPLMAAVEQSHTAIVAMFATVTCKCEWCNVYPGCYAFVYCRNDGK